MAINLILTARPEPESRRKTLEAYTKTCAQMGQNLMEGYSTSLVVLSLTLSIYKIMPGPMVDLAERN